MRQIETHTTFYISTHGDDHWSGRLPAPDANQNDGPFATLTGARLAVRELKGQGDLPGPVVVLLRGGKYFLDQPLVLGSQDSGTQSCPVSYRAYPGEAPILSGGKRVSGWQAYQDQIWRCALPGSKGGKWKFRQLFYQGQRQEQARWPRRDPDNPLYGGWAFMEGPASAEWPLSSTAFRYKPGTFPHSWSRPSELEAHYFSGTGCWPSRVPVKTVDEDQRTITLVHGGLQFDVPPWYQTIVFARDNRFYVLNGLEDLTAPGDWCFDSEEGMLYFWPPAGNLDLDSAEVVVPYLDCLVDLRGASWVTLAGLTFTETLDGDNFHHEGVEGAGAMYPHPGWRYSSDAVHLKDTEHCRVEDCVFDAVGGNGVYLEGHNARNTIAYNEFSQAGANAICLLGTRLKHPIFNTVSDNAIHDCGTLNKYTAGIFLGMSDGNLISHNRFERLPHHAINLSNSPFGRNIVEYNDIRFADQEVNDSAAINCWMEEPPDKNVQRCGHIIRFNYIADTYACAVTDGQVLKGINTLSSGIYLDNYTSNCFVYGNVVVRAAAGGIILSAGKNNFIENNILVDCLYAIRPQDFSLWWEFWKPMAGFMTGNHFLHNIVYTRQPGASILFFRTWTDRTLAQCDENIYFYPGGTYTIFDESQTDPDQRVISFARWLSLGYDQHSRLVDPQFQDLEHDDYRLSPSSPALELGFMPIDFSKIGIRLKKNI